MKSKHMSSQHSIVDSSACKLAIAEDDDDVRNALAQLFVQDGFEVTQVANGELLVQLLETSAHFPDLLIMDHRMPGFSGLEILNVLQRMQWNIPVVMMTAFGREVFAAARSLGACAVFEKPFDLDDLRTAVYFYSSRSRCAAVTDVEVVGGEIRDAEFCRVVAAEVRSWRFPPRIRPSEDGDLDLLFSDSWEQFEVWIRQTLGGDFTWRGSPRDTPERLQIIIDSVRAAMASNDGVFPQADSFLERFAS